MTRRLRCLNALSMAVALAALARCGGGAAAPATGRIDPETGVMSSEAAPKARRRPAPAKGPSTVTLLSLEGIPMPEPPADPSKEGAEVEAKGRAVKAATPPAQAPDANAPPPRNLFAFEEDPAIVMERRKQAEEAAKTAQEAAKKADLARKRWQGPPLPPPPPQPPAIPFQFIGYMGPPEARIGVFSAQGITLARKGDVIQNQFKVVSIGYESAEIGFQGFTQTQRIPLTPGGK